MCPHGCVCRLKIWTIACQIRRDVWSDRPTSTYLGSPPITREVYSTLLSRRGGSRLELGPSAHGKGRKDPPAHTWPNYSIWPSMLLLEAYAAIHPTSD